MNKVCFKLTAVLHQAARIGPHQQSEDLCDADHISALNSKTKMHM